MENLGLGTGIFLWFRFHWRAISCITMIGGFGHLLYYSLLAPFEWGLTSKRWESVGGSAGSKGKGHSVWKWHRYGMDSTVSTRNRTLTVDETAPSFKWVQPHPHPSSVVIFLSRGQKQVVDPGLTSQPPLPTWSITGHGGTQPEDPEPVCGCWGKYYLQCMATAKPPTLGEIT